MYGDVHVFHLKYGKKKPFIRNKINKIKGPVYSAQYWVNREPCALAHGVQLAFAQRSLHGSK